MQLSVKLIHSFIVICVAIVSKGLSIYSTEW